MPIHSLTLFLDASDDVVRAVGLLLVLLGARDVRALVVLAHQAQQSSRRPWVKLVRYNTVETGYCDYHEGSIKIRNGVDDGF